MTNHKYLSLLLGVVLAFAASPAQSQGLQISEGVRVTSQVGEVGFGPNGSPYMISPQPPIDAYMTDKNDRLFDGAIDLLKFFQSFPHSVQRNGLWITPAGLAERQTQEDKKRLSQLIQAAHKQKVLMYVCAAGPSGRRSGLVAWECTQRSPSGASKTLRCIPRDKPHLDHPWWDCTEERKEGA